MTQKRYEKQEKLIMSQLSPRAQGQEYENFQFSTPEQRTAVERFIYAARDGKWIFLYGNPGTGKGHMATVVFKEKLRAFKTAIMMNAFDMFREIKLNYLESEAILDKFYQVDCLIIDEIEKFGGSARETEKDYLFSIINYRYEFFKQTIIISNDEYQNIERLLTKPIIDRFTEMGGVVNFNWSSYRAVKK